MARRSEATRLLEWGIIKMPKRLMSHTIVIGIDATTSGCG